jgi:plasmid stabilization system protein ParE
LSDFQRTDRPGDSRAAAVAGTAQQKAGESAGLVGDKATEVVGTAKEQASHTADEAVAQARDLAQEVRTQLQEQAQTQTRRLAENVRRLAEELQDMGRHGKQGSSAAGVVQYLADGGHKAASRLEERGPDGLVGDLRNFARRRPGVFLAGAALAGFAVARAGKGVSAAGSGPDTTGTPRGGTTTAPARPDTLGGGAPVAPTAYGEDPLDTYGQSQPSHYTPGGARGATAPAAQTDPRRTT